MTMSPDIDTRPSRWARLAPRRRLLPLLLVAMVLGLVPLAGTDAAPAAPYSAGGWTTEGTVSAESIGVGQTITFTATATPARARRALVDLEVYGPGGQKVFQQTWTHDFQPAVRKSFSAGWRLPSDAALGGYTVKIGVFRSNWSTLYHWNNGAGSFAAVAATTTTLAPTTTTMAPTTTTVAPTTTTAKPTTTTTAPTTTTTTAPPTGGGRFVTLAAGATLPGDAECAARVRPAAEIRPANATANATRGFGSPSNPPAPLLRRVTGNFTGTTDEIIQWASCKWGFDEDMIRAQTAKESWWIQSTVGDNGESFGVQQVRLPYWGWAFNGGNGDARTSTAFNLDAALAARRNCFEGNEGWVSQFSPGRPYVAGDLWGCMGLWFSGRWYDSWANDYINAVRDLYNQRIWTTSGFRSG
jgi:hypothetical protein